MFLRNLSAVGGCDWRAVNRVKLWQLAYFFFCLPVPIWSWINFNIIMFPTSLPSKRVFFSLSFSFTTSSSLSLNRQHIHNPYFPLLPLIIFYFAFFFIWCVCYSGHSNCITPWRSLSPLECLGALPSARCLHPFPSDFLVLFFDIIQILPANRAPFVTVREQNPSRSDRLLNSL